MIIHAFITKEHKKEGPIWQIDEQFTLIGRA